MYIAYDIKTGSVLEQNLDSDTLDRICKLPDKFFRHLLANED